MEQQSRMFENQSYSENQGHAEKTHLLIVRITQSRSPGELWRLAFQTHIPSFSNQAKNMFPTLPG